MFKIIKMSENTKEYIETFYIIFEEMRKSMEAVTATDCIAQNYINRIIPHHEAEIKMAENILKFTTDVELEELARQMIAEAKANLETLNTLKDTCTQENSPRDVMLYEKGYEEAYNKMIAKMSASQSGNNVNIDFLTEMIPHHEGGINIGKNLLKFEDRKSVV